MIVRPHVFDDSHLPRTLLHREGEGEVLAEAVRPAGAGEPADNVLVHGSSGVGKTALVRHTLRRMEDKLDVPSTHIRTLGATRGQVLRDAIAGHPRGERPATNVPVGDLEVQLRELVDEPYVVILDEADDLASTDIPGTLLDVPALSIVVICHDEEAWCDQADSRVERALGHRLRVQRFSTSELADILERRADIGLVYDAVTTDQLREIADEVVGVAREGIQSLRAAAELAEERDHPHITDEDIADSYQRARRAIRRSNLASLTVHHQLLYALVISGEGWRRSREIHAEYEDVAESWYRDKVRQPIGQRARRNKLRKLVEYDLLEREDDGPEPHYRPVDTSVSPAVDLSPAETR